MTRKHFVQMAADVSAIRDPEERRRAAERAADFCAGQNSRFDRGRFLAACELDTTPTTTRPGRPRARRLMVAP